MAGELPFRRTLKVGCYGLDVSACKRATYRLLKSKQKWDRYLAQTTFVRSTFGVFFRRDLILAQKLLTAGRVAGQFDEETLRAFEDAKAFDDTAKRLWRLASQPKPTVPQLGPVTAGAPSVLLHDLTHATDGVPGFPAFDDAFGQPGKIVLAPEALTVTRLGHAVRRDGNPDGRIVYATGASRIRYCFVHLEDVPAVGTRIKSGGRIAVISANHEVPHLHVGIDARPLIGRELDHHTDYSHGGRTVGAQLADR